jgi:hypothetical protein
MTGGLKKGVATLFQIRTGNMRSIRLILISGGLAAIALIFMMRARADAPSSFKADDIKGTYAFQMVPVKSFSSDNPVSSGLAAGPYQDILRVGVLTATPDSATSAHGTLSGKTIATIDNNSGSTRVVVFKWTGNYGVNTDGTGVFTVEALAPTTTVSCFDSADNSVAPPAIVPPYPPPPLAGMAPSGQTCDFGGAASVEGKESYAFVISKRHQNFQFAETDNGPGGGGAKIFLTGQATKQEKQEE